MKSIIMKQSKLKTISLKIKAAFNTILDLFSDTIDGECELDE